MAGKEGGRGEVKAAEMMVGSDGSSCGEVGSGDDDGRLLLGVPARRPGLRLTCERELGTGRGSGHTGT